MKKGLIKNLGLILIGIGIFLFGFSLRIGHVNNKVLGGSLMLIIGGLLVYIVINKRIGNNP